MQLICVRMIGCRRRLHCSQRVERPLYTKRRHSLSNALIVSVLDIPKTCGSAWCLLAPLQKYSWGLAAFEVALVTASASWMRPTMP